MSNEAANASRPHPADLLPDLRGMTRVLRSGEYLMLCKVVGMCICSGRSLPALSILGRLGISKDTANLVIEGWPMDDSRFLPSSNFTTAEEAALRLTHYVDFDTFAWPEMLEEALAIVDDFGCEMTKTPKFQEYGV